MDEAILGALVRGYEHLIDSVVLPDENDRHVVAAAIHAGAPVIVTGNLKDFPAAALAAHGIEAVHPDDFIARLIREHPDEACAAVKEIRERLKKPAHSPESYIKNLRGKELNKTADELEKYKDDI
jgi:hypothetical protein